MGRATTVACWLVLALLAPVALLQVVGMDRTAPVVGLFTVPLLTYLPAWAALAAAFLRRRWVAVAVAAAVCVAQVVIVAPELRATHDVAAEARTAPTVRLLTWNVYIGNRDAAGIDRQVRQADADLVVLEETGGSAHAAILGSPALGAYPFMSTQTHGGNPSMLFSRFPIRQPEDLYLAGSWMARAVVDLPAGPVRLYAVHTLSPQNTGEPHEWRAELDDLRVLAAAETLPVLMVGDFNATWGHPHFRRLLSGAHLVDAAAARGHALAATWPQQPAPLTPIFRLDHVLTDDHRLVVTDIRRGAGPGSDHRPLIATVAMVGRFDEAGGGGA